jgi:hypothetical protein
LTYCEGRFMLASMASAVQSRNFQLLLLLLVAAFMVGCTSSHRVAARRTPQAATSTPTATSTPAASERSTEAQNSTTSAPLCRTQQIQIGLVGEASAGGSIVLKFTFRNASGTPCLAQGYVGMSFLDQEGRDLGVRSEPYSEGYIPLTTTATPSVLGREQETTFAIEYGDNAVNGGFCPTVDRLAITPPRERRAIVVKVSPTASLTRLAPCGTVQIGPLGSS